MGPEPLSFLEIQTRTGWGRTLRAFADWCGPQPGWVTLDVGCGPGLLPAYFTAAGCVAFGIDLEAAALTSDRLHPDLVQASAYSLPFPAQVFDLVTASNLLFLLEEPLQALCEFRRIVRPGGRVSLLNPSEKMSLSAALALADERGLQGLARASLLNWARLAESHAHWGEAELDEMLAKAGLCLKQTDLKIGSGLARLAMGTCSL